MAMRWHFPRKFKIFSARTQNPVGHGLVKLQTPFKLIMFDRQSLKLQFRDHVAFPNLAFPSFDKVEMGYRCHYFRVSSFKVV